MSVSDLLGLFSKSDVILQIICYCYVIKKNGDIKFNTHDAFLSMTFLVYAQSQMLYYKLDCIVM